MLEKLWAQDTTKLNHVELVKLEKDGLESATDVKGYGDKKFTDLTPDDIERLKWVGLYLQNPKTAGYFMMRVKVPGGLITAEQLKVIAGIAKDYGQGIVDITIRQADLQFHWLTVDALPDNRTFRKRGTYDHRSRRGLSKECNGPCIGRN